MADEFEATLALIPSADVVMATLTVSQKDGATNTLTVSRERPVAAATITHDGNPILQTVIVINGERQLRANFDPIAGSWSLHAQIIRSTLAAAYVSHVQASAPPTISCPKQPKHRITCPGTLVCSGDKGESYVLTC